MKIAWFSPRIPDLSDIANFTQRLEGEIRQRFDARFLTEQPAGFYEPAADRLVPVALGHPAQSVMRTLHEVDVPIYNLGNNPAFFSKTWFLSQEKPGIVILHDLKLHHFFEGIYRERLGDESRYLALMNQYYGRPGVEAGRLYWRQQIGIDFMAEHFPMTAWAVRNALAVVVHTPHALDVVQRETDAPAWLNSLSYAPTHSRARASTGSLPPGPFSPGRPARLVIFGYLNVNRRVTECLQALAGMEERACFELQIFGQLWQGYEGEVKRSVEKLGLGSQVRFHGYVSEEALDAGLAKSDLAINLRFPTMGEASGAQLRIWDHALPSLVTRTGGYATLPEEAVNFVRPDHEKADIQEHLRDFLRRPEFYRQKGVMGREILCKHHLPATYVERLGQLCEHLSDLRSRHNRLALADRAAKALSPWVETTSRLALEHRYATTIAETC